MTPEQDNLYENATKKLLKTIDRMGLQRIDSIRAKNLTLLFRDAFKMPDVKYKTLGEKADFFQYDSDGFCRASSISFNTLISNSDDWKLIYIDDLWTFGPHHYLLHMPSKTVFDLTYDQYEYIGITEIPYFLGQQIPTIFAPDDLPDKFIKSININVAKLSKNQKE